MVSVRVLADDRTSLDPRRFAIVAAGEQVVLAATTRRPSERQAATLRSFVRRGGGLVLAGGTLAAWSGDEAIRELAGWVPGLPGPETELIVRPDREHPVTQRLDAEWRIRDRLHVSEGPPAGATVLARASWRFTEQVVAYERPFGKGRFVYLGLRDDGSTIYAKLLARLLLFAAGRTAAPAVGVGLVGYGAIGREHAASVAATSGLRLAAVCDLSPERRDAGRHVVCEKPFAVRVEDADRMMDAAASHRRVLTVYQSRRWDPDYVALRDAARSGRAGEPFYMESFIGGYDHPCDFWHSHEPVSGGTVYDWGSHYFDWILQLFDERVRTVTANAHKRVWHDVTNDDQVRVDLTFAGGQQATFLQSGIAAARKPKWYLLGTRGAIVGDWADADVPADLPARVTVFTRAGEERLSLPARDEHGFYRNLADHLAWGEPLAVPPEEARRNVAIMEAATQSLKRDGAQLMVDI